MLTKATVNEGIVLWHRTIHGFGLFHHGGETALISEYGL